MTKVTLSHKFTISNIPLEQFLQTDITTKQHHATTESFCFLYSDFQGEKMALQKIELKFGKHHTQYSSTEHSALTKRARHSAYDGELD